MDCGGLLSYNYLSGEHVTGFDEGRPLFVRKPDSNFNLANFIKLHLYSSNKGGLSENICWKGSAGYFDEMPKVFKLSKINLNISLKCIQSGIPLRALDILASGGFLLSNYQPELAEYFTDGEDLVLYYSMEDAWQKCEYYLKHEDERKAIAANGREKAKAFFSYEKKLQEMFTTAGFQL